MTCQNASNIARALPTPKRLVIKIGSSILTQALDSTFENTDSGQTQVDYHAAATAPRNESKTPASQKVDSSVQVARIQALCAEIATLKATIPEIILVSSGAVACGFSLLGFPSRPKDIIDKQACAAVGQARLLWHYEQAFREHGLQIAQILLTKDDLSNPKRYLYASAALRRLLELQAIPIINENDPVLVDELKYIETFGDNDNLAALVAGMVDADLLLILSDVDGLYTANPATNPSAKRIGEVHAIDESIFALAGESPTSGAVGTGGMASKLHAAKKAVQRGCNVAIIKGDDARNIKAFLSGADIGTYFHLPTSNIKKRRFYIGYVAIPQGKLIVDSGALRALRANKSLLPKGVLSVEGIFEAGDVVSVYDECGQEIARGKSRYNAHDSRLIIGKDSARIGEILGQSYGDCLLHKDDIALLDT